MRKSLLMVALAAALPFHMSDVTASAAPAEDPNAGASPAADAPASDTTSSATSAPADAATDTTAAPAAEVAPAAPASTAPVNENTGNVEIASDSHAEAKDRFAGLLAKIHQFEQDTVDELRTELMAIGTLLHLHTKASTDAATTGDYKATDLS